MRKVNFVHVIILILCLAATGYIIYMRPVSSVVEKSVSLEQTLAQLNEKYRVTQNRLSPRIVEELKLDDYVFQTYMQNNNSVSLYVGYYFTGKKVGAAHDPQICYPGQGWKLSNKQRQSTTLKAGMTINYSSIIADLNGKKELIYYWFQVDDKTADNTFHQKIVLFQKQILQQGESNAFVRISTSLNDQTEEQAKDVLMNFIADFYPVFYRYSTN